MYLASRRIRWTAALAVASITAGAAFTAAAAAGGSAHAATAPGSGLRTITARLLTVTPGTLRPGARVRQAELRTRVFVDARHGFALADVGQATYPAATSDGGHTWRTSGPALVVHAAKAPLEVSEIGAVSRRLYFAAGEAQAVDVTPDGGRHWYQALLPGGVIAVVGRGVGLVAVVEGGESSPPTNWVYVSTDGGRRWTYEEQL
jgi:hypothetical protein